MLLRTESCVFRVLVFVVACFMSLGTYFSYHVPSVLQKKFEGPLNISCDDAINASTNQSTTMCCIDCLGLTSLQYNYLFAGYSWTNALTVILCGFFIDKFGNGVSGMFFTSVVIVGVSMFACGSLASVRGTPISFILLLTGRILQGAATGGVRVVQDRAVVFWFKQDVSVAFGFLVAFARSISVINFLMTNVFARTYGLSSTLWMSAGICGTGFLAAVALYHIDTYGLRQLRLHRRPSKHLENTSLSDIRKFPLLFWYIVLCMLFFYSATIPFIADASKFIQDKFHFSSLTASYISGIVFDICVVFSPIFGFILDHIGQRGWCILLLSVISLPVFPLLAFTDVHPAIVFTIMGVSYSMTGVCTWSAISMVIHMSNLGLAFGVTTSVLNIGIGVTNWGVGEFLGQNKNLSVNVRLNHWRSVLLLSFINILLTIIFSIITNIHDTRLGIVINAKKRKTVHEGGLISSSSEAVTPIAVNETSRLLGDPPILSVNDVTTPRKLTLSYSALM